MNFQVLPAPLLLTNFDHESTISTKHLEAFDHIGDGHWILVPQVVDLLLCDFPARHYKNILGTTVDGNQKSGVISAVEAGR